MRQIIKQFLWVVLLASSLSAAWGFALLGPVAEAPGPGGAGGAQGDTWQTLVIGYNPISTWDTLPIGPKNIGEEYRRNTPVMYYAFDQNFAGFFGSNGEVAVDGAFATMNGVFTNNPTGTSHGLDGYTNLSVFPLNSQSINYTAQALGLTDLKSETLHLLVEQMGLINPVRYVWTLHGRALEPGTTCPEGEVYNVVQRNFDIIASPLNQLQYSPYVNGTLYSYGIAEYCTAPNSAFAPAGVLALAVPIPANPPAEPYDIYNPVASEGGWIFSSYPNPPPGSYLAGLFFTGGLETGGFYTGLTRDDMAGLRYLMTSNNINWEAPGGGSQFQATNDILHSIVLMTSNLTDLALFSTTNAPDVVQAAFPGVVVGSYSNYWTVQQVPNVVAYYTNLPGSPFGNPPTLVVTTNGFTPVPVLVYKDVFANLVTTNYSSNTVAYRQTVTVSTPIGAPFGNPPVTNYSALSRVILTNVPSGDYYVIPPGTCGYNIVSPLYTNVTRITNVISTLATASTSASNGTNYTAYVNIVTIFTNHWYVVEPCVFAANATGWYQGIQRVQFVRVPDGWVDPLTGNFIQPITNTYQMVWYNPTNYTVSTRTFQRIVTQPDILFSAEDMAGTPLAMFFSDARNVNFDDANRLPGLAGPGVINPSTTITFNKVGDIYFDGPGAGTNVFLGEDANPTTSMLAWGSFDGTTNDPVVYPNGTSIQNLENQLIISVSPTLLPDGTNGVAYPATSFTVTGGQSPYVWSASGLPAGFNLSSDGTFSCANPGAIVNAVSGTYDFTIQLTDSADRVVSLNYSMTIH